AQLQRAVGDLGRWGGRVHRLGNGLTDGGQDRGRQVSQDGDGFGFNGGADTDRLTQKDGGIGLAVLAFGDNFGYKHAYIIVNIIGLSTNSLAFILIITCLHSKRSWSGANPREIKV